MEPKHSKYTERPPMWWMPNKQCKSLSIIFHDLCFVCGSTVSLFFFFAHFYYYLAFDERETMDMKQRPNTHIHTHENCILMGMFRCEHWIYHTSYQRIHTQTPTFSFILSRQIWWIPWPSGKKANNNNNNGSKIASFSGVFDVMVSLDLFCKHRHCHWI